MKETIKGIPFELMDIKQLLNTKFDLVDESSQLFRDIIKLKDKRLSISAKIRQIEDVLREKCRK